MSNGKITQSIFVILCLLSGFSTAQNDFTKQVISTNPDFILAIDAKDIDLDGDTDVVVASLADFAIRWYENDGTGSFIEHLIDELADDAIAVEAADMDQDGDIDILSMEEGYDGLVLRKNDGNQQFDRGVITDDIDFPKALSVADLDDDLDLDIVIASSSSEEVFWLENAGGLTFVRHLLLENTINPYSSQIIDLDDDGDQDIILAALLDNFGWFENDGNQNFVHHTILDNSTEAWLCATDIDDDSDIDIISQDAGIFHFGLHLNDGSEQFSSTYYVTDPLTGAAIAAADIDIDGDKDVIIGGYGAGLTVFANDGNEVFSGHEVGASEVKYIDLADFDGDGDLDVLAAIRDDEISWYENLLPQLSISVTVDSTYTPVPVEGDTIQYTLFIENTILDTITQALVNVELVDPLERVRSVVPGKTLNFIPGQSREKSLWLPIQTQSPGGAYRLRASVSHSAGSYVFSDSVYFSKVSRVEDSLVGYWSFTGNANDESGHGNDGITNDVLLTVDRFGNDSSAYYFNGGGSNIDVGSGNSLDDISTLTLSAWIYLDSFGDSGFGRIFNKGLGTSGTKIFFVDNSLGNERLRFFHDFSDNEASWGTPDYSIPTGQWIFVAVTYDNSSTTNSAAIYIDGVLQELTQVQSPAGTALSDSIYSGFIGNNDSGERGFHGTLDEVRIHNRILSSDDINALYQDTKPPISSDQVSGPNHSMAASSFVLHQNYPNPFNPSTNIGFDIPQETDVRLDIYDITGRLVRVLVNDKLNAGTYTIVWDGTNTTGSRVSSGVYLYTIQARASAESKKMLLIY